MIKDKCNETMTSIDVGESAKKPRMQWSKTRGFENLYSLFLKSYLRIKAKSLLEYNRSKRVVISFWTLLVIHRRFEIRKLTWRPKKKDWSSVSVGLEMQPFLLYAIISLCFRDFSRWKDTSFHPKGHFSNEYDDIDDGSRQALNLQILGFACFEKSRSYEFL